MSHAKQASKRKHRRKAVPMLGAAGLSLSLASGASAAIGGPADMPTRNAGVSHEITLGEEEICDVSLATFHIFDKENAGTFRSGGRLAMSGSAGVGCGCMGCGGCGGCWSGNKSYTAPVSGNDADQPHHSIKPAHQYRHALKRKHLSKSQ